MGRWFQNFLRQGLRGFFPLILLFSGVWGCSGASPPAPIPSPVSSLMTVSNPDGSSNVVVTGGPGSVQPGSTVSAGVVGSTSLRWEALWIRQAHAQEEGSVLDAMTIAKPDGSFSVVLGAQVGQIIRVIQIVAGSVSPPTDLIVDTDTIALAQAPQGLALHPVDGVLHVTASDQTDGLIYSFFLGGSDLLLSFPSPAIVVPGLSGIGPIAIDEVNDQAVVASPEQNAVQLVSLVSGSAAPVLSLGNPLTVQTIPGTAMAVVGQGTDVSLSFIDTATNGVACTFDIPPPTAAKHLGTPFVSVQSNTSGVSVILVASEFQGGLWAVSQVFFVGCSPGPVLSGQVVLPPGVIPSGLSGFNSGDFALVSDEANDQTLEISFITDAVTRFLPVGDNPQGLGISAFNSHGYVVNNGDNSITSINLANFALSTVGNVGILPKQIVIDPASNQGAVISTFDQSVVIVDLGF